MMPPRLLNRDQAREYLGGARPDTLLAPIRLGGRLVWDRLALDRELDRRSGLASGSEPSADSGEGLKRALDRISKKKASAGENTRRA